MLARVLLLSSALCASSAVHAAAAFYAAAGKEEITPDPARDTVYLAGYGDKGRRARGVHDPLYARGVVLSDGERMVALVAVDLIGLFQEDVKKIRERLELKPGKQALLLAATHTHNGPDTLGLWGRFMGVSGVDPAYQQFVRDKVVRLVRRLAGSLQEAEMLSAVKPVEMKGRCKDWRDPVVMDPEMAVIRFRSLLDRTVIGTVVDWSCHPEVIGRDNTLVTADFPGALCAKMEKDSQAPCVYFSGSIGGMQSPDREALRQGRKDDWEAMIALGEMLAADAEGILKGAERSEPQRLHFQSETVRLTVANSRYHLFLPAVAFGHVLLDAGGRPLEGWRLYATSLRHALFRLKPGDFPRIDTEVSRIAFGPVDIAGIPGELFPELAHGGYDGRYTFGYPLINPANPAPPDLARAPQGPYLKDRLRGRHRFVIGLANDEIGYILPAYDFVTSDTLLMEPHPPGHHYEETNSVGRDTADKILGAAAALLID